MPVAHLAKHCGLTRQAVQRLVDDLVGDGLAIYAPNPYHQRAKLALLTSDGQASYETALKRWGAWLNNLGAKLTIKEIEALTASLRVLGNQLDLRPPNQ